MKGMYTAKTDIEAFRAYLMNIREYNQKHLRKWVFLYPSMTKDKLRTLIRAKRQIAVYSKIVSEEITKERPDMIVLQGFNQRRYEICAETEKEILI